MILKKLAIKNLRSYERQEIEFPKGSILLSGDIGTGKTTILLAIEFALFGLQPSQKGSSLLRSRADFGSVKLEFEIEGKNIILERTLKRGAKSVSQDYASITIDNERFEGSITEIKSKVLKLLNYPSEFAKKTNLLYKFTVYTPQEEMKQIILEPRDIRLNTLRHVFGIDKYKRIEENTSIVTSKLREKIRTNEGMIYDLDIDKENLKSKQDELAEKKENQKKAAEDYENAVSLREEKESDLKEVQEKIDEKKSLETEKEKSQILISEKKQQVTSLKNTINSLNLQIQEARKISFSKEEFNFLNQKIELQQSREEEMQKEYIQIISKINSEQSKKKETTSLKNKISKLEKCPTCLQEVSEEYKDNIFKRTDEEMQEIQRILNNLNLRKNELDEKLEVIKTNKENFKKRKSELELLKVKLENLKERESRIDELLNQIDYLKKDLEILEKHVTTTEKSIKEYEKYDSIFKKKDDELKKAKINEDKLAIKKAEINKEIQFIHQQIKEIKEEINKKQEIKKQTKEIKEVEYWISEKYMALLLLTEKQVMLTLKEEFSKLFSKWFSILVSESLTASLDDNFSPVIEQQDYELDYSFLSGGERTAIALAYRLALNQVINSLLSKINTKNLVILDEPTDGFSAQQLDKMRDVLNQLNTEQLILVSHEPKIEGFVDNVLRLRKDLGITKIEK